MDSALPFRSVLSPGAKGTGRPYLLLPSRHRSGWLLPADPGPRRAGLRAFGHRGWRECLGGAFLAARRLGGEQLWLDVAPLECELARAVGASSVRLAFCIGTSGPSRKLTAQVMTPEDHVPAYAKIAEDGPAQASLECEHRNLLRLSTIDGVRHRVPAVLASFPWHGTRVLVITAGSGQVGPRRLTGMHAEFLQQLRDASAEERSFEASAMWARMTATVRRLTPRVSPAWRLRCQRALTQLGASLGWVVLPLSIAHRDFAPWNTRVGPQGLFVFDWEVAAEEMTPCYDVFHYEAIQAAHAGRPFHPSRRPAPEPRWKAYLPHLYLAYLMDMGLCYAEAQLRAPVGQERVCRWFGQHIDAYVEACRALA